MYCHAACLAAASVARRRGAGRPILRHCQEQAGLAGTKFGKDTLQSWPQDAVEPGAIGGRGGHQHQIPYASS